MVQKNWLSDKDYDFIFSRAPKVCVDLVIKNKKGVLLSKRLIEPYKNFWHLPGGRVKFREPLANAVQRIASAEIGVKVKIEKLVGYMEFLREVQNGKNRHSISLVLQVLPLKNNFKGGWQGEELGFFKKGARNIHPIHLKMLKQNKLLS